MESEVIVELESRVESERVAGHRRRDEGAEVERPSSGGAVGGTKSEEGRVLMGGHIVAVVARRVRVVVKLMRDV